MKEKQLLKSQDARRIIRDINRLNLENVDFKHLKNKLGTLLYCSFPGDLIDINHGFYRANIVDEGRPVNVARLSYPPYEKIADYQRCNSPGFPVFYCAPDQGTACSEIYAKIGNTVYVSNWIVTHPFFCTNIALPMTYGDASDLVNTFIETKFVQEIHKTFSHQYKVTAAIIEMLFSEPNELIPVHDSVKGNVVPFGMSAVKYPSIATGLSGYCYAIKTDAVDNCLKLESVLELKIENIEGSRIGVTCTDKSLKILEDGTIEWCKG